MSLRYIHGCAIVTVAVAVNLKEFSRRLDKGDCDGMFTSALYAVGSAPGSPATHYISVGAIPRPYAQTLADPVLLYTRAKAAWEADGDVFPHTQLQVTNAWNKCDFSQDDGFAAMARMNLEPARSAL